MSPDAIWVTVLSFSSLFCISKVMHMHPVEVFEGGVVVVDELSVLEEMEILECEYIRASFFLLLNFDIFA